jgi:hypothetical protein
MAMISGNDIAQIAAPSPITQGGIWRAPLGTDLPTDNTTDLDDAFISLGYVDDDGVTINIDRPNTKQYAWGGTLITSLQQHYATTFTFKLYQVLDPDVLKAVHSDGNVTVTAATPTAGTITKVSMNATLNMNSVWAIDSFYQTAMLRFALPNARVTQVGNYVLTHKTLAVYPVTLEAFPDSNGNLVYQISDDGILSA